MDSLLTVKLWAAAAWADGELHPTEAAALKRLIEASDDLSGEARAEAMTYLSAKPEVSVEDVNDLDEPARQGVLRAAQQIVAIDGLLKDEEMAFLDKLKKTLELDESTKSKIESEAE
jgi:tellurite resistance protein